MRVSLIIFHKNINQYPKAWIDKFIESIRQQTYKDFDVFELNYGGTDEMIYEGSIFESLRMPTHADAHNYLLDKVFSMGYNYAFNTNVDDYYSPNRIERQLEYMNIANNRFDMVSSNFYNIDEENNIIRTCRFNQLNIANNLLSKNHNVIAHPACCYSKKFWLNCSKLNPLEIPRDDFELWKREIKKGARFYVVPDYLLYYSVHQNKVSKP